MVMGLNSWPSLVAAPEREVYGSLPHTRPLLQRSTCVPAFTTGHLHSSTLPHCTHSPCLVRPVADVEGHVMVHQQALKQRSTCAHAAHTHTREAFRARWMGLETNMPS